MEIYNEKKESLSLEEMYEKMMNTLPPQILDFSRWEKVGEMYKQYSIYDASKYETKLSSSIIIKK